KALAASYRCDGSLDFVNQTWRTCTGLSQDSLRGQRWGVAIHPDDLSRVEAACSPADRRGVPDGTAVAARRWQISLASGAPRAAVDGVPREFGLNGTCTVRNAPLLIRRCRT